MLKFFEKFKKEKVESEDDSNEIFDTSLDKESSYPSFTMEELNLLAEKRVKKAENINIRDKKGLKIFPDTETLKTFNKVSAPFVVGVMSLVASMYTSDTKLEDKISEPVMMEDALVNNKGRFQKQIDDLSTESKVKIEFKKKPRVKIAKNNGKYESRDSFSEQDIAELCDDSLKIYHQISSDEELWDSELLTDDFFIAQQLQESAYESKAVSKSGAVGVMQNMPISIKDVVRYFGILNRRGIIKYNGPSWEKLTEENISDIQKRIQENPNYSRAFGKIYMVMLNKNYKIDNKRELLVCYNMGTSGKGKTDEQLKKIRGQEPYNYYTRILERMDLMKEVRGFYRDKIGEELSNYELMKLIREMYDVHNSKKDRLSFLNKRIKNKV